MLAHGLMTWRFDIPGRDVINGAGAAVLWLLADGCICCCTVC